MNETKPPTALNEKQPVTEISTDPDFNETYADIQLALSDVNPKDREALNKRVLQILDDIHSGRF